MALFDLTNLLNPTMCFYKTQYYFQGTYHLFHNYILI